MPRKTFFSVDGIQIFCKHDKLVPVGKVKPNPKNPNKHPPGQIALLAEVIQGNGWRRSIVVSKRSGLVVE